MNKRVSAVILMVGLVFVGPSLFAAADFIPIQERAQGQSLTGGTLLNDSLYSNPASSAFTNVYSVGSNWFLPKSFEASVLDTKTSSIGGGLGYFRNLLPDQLHAVQGMKLGLIHRLSNVIGVGVTGKTVWGPDANGNDAHLTDADLGVLANWQVLTAGLVLRNVMGGNKLLQDEERDLALGVRMNYSDQLFFSVTAESHVAQVTPYQYGFGAEYVSPYYFALKGGYFFQPGGPTGPLPSAAQPLANGFSPMVPGSAWTAGVSMLTPRLSLHYAVELPQTAGYSIEHQLAMTLLF